jgi:hypothetical protein
MSKSGVDAIVTDYFARLRRALAPLPRSRRNQLLEDLREHVSIARAGLSEESELSVREIFEHLGTPDDIAAEALAPSLQRPGRWRLRRGRSRLRPGPFTRRTGLALATAVAVVTAGGTFVAIAASSGASSAAARTDAAVIPFANSHCSPQTDAATSGGPASTLTGKATEVAHGAVAGHSWSLWSARGQSGANGLEEGGLVIDGRAYGLCPGFPNPAELELADVGPAGLVYGVIGYPGLAKVDLYQSTAGTFDRGLGLPSPSVTVVRGVSFFIGTLPKSACDYSSLELNATSPGVSAEHNLGFGHCTAGQLVPITASQGIWQLPPGQFPSGFGGPGGGGGSTVPLANSDCSPQTDAATSGGPASTLTSKATEVAHGTVAGQAWSLWSARGQSGANGLEEGGLVVDGRAYGLCPGFPNPAELELADIGPAGLVYGVIGYHGLAKVHLYQSTPGTFDQGPRLPSPSVTVVRGVSFFIGTLPKSACDYSSLELNSTSPGVSAEHNLGFGHCTAGQLVPITASQGIWQLKPGQFPSGFGGLGGGGAGGGQSGPPGFPAPDSDCYPQTNAATSGGSASTLMAKATEVAHGTVAGHAWSLWSARGQSGANGLEDGGLVVDSRAYGLCPGFPNPAELELADIGPAGLVYGVIGYPGLAQVRLYTSTTGTFDTGQALPAPSVTVVHGVSFFIGTLPKSACDYRSLELNSAAKQGSSQHNLGFGSCVTGKLVQITASQGIWTAGR